MGPESPIGGAIARKIADNGLARSRRMAQQSAQAEKAYAKRERRSGLAPAKATLATVLAQIGKAESRKLED